MNKKLTIILGILFAFAAGFGMFWTLSSHNVSQVVIPYQFEVKSKDPQKNSDGWTTSITRQINSTLTVVNNKDKVENWNASKIDVSKDKLTYNITLNKDFSWEDNKAVTAKDYYFGLKHLLDPKTKSEYASWALDYIKGSNAFYAGKSKEISGFKVINDNQIQISLVKPCKYFTYLLSASAFAPLREDYFNKHKEDYGTSWDKVLSSGIYKINKFRLGSYVSLDLNKNSKKSEDTKVKSIKFVKVETKEDEYQLYKQNKIANYLEKSNLGKVDGESKWLNNAEQHYIVPNNKVNTKYLNNAFYYALDKNYITNTLLKGFGTTTGAIYSTNQNKGYVNENKNLYSLEKAKEFLKQDTSNKRVVNLLVTTITKPELLKYIINQESKIGIKVNIRYTTPLAIDKEMFAPAASERNYDFALNVWNQNYDDIHAYTSEFINPFISYINAYNSEIEKKVNNFDNESAKYFADNGLLFTLWQTKSKLHYKSNIVSYSPTAYFLNGYFWSK